MTEPLQVNIDNFPVTVTKDADGTVEITIEIGFPVGNQTLTIPKNEWQQIAQYIEQS